MLRVLLFLLVIPLLLLVVAALLIPLFLDESKLLALATETLERRTGARLEVAGEAQLSLFPDIALKLGDADMVLPGENPPALSARSLAIGVQLMPLFSGQVEIEGLEIDGLEVTLPPSPRPPSAETAAMSDAELDAYYRARRTALQEAGARGAGGALALPMALEVARLSVSDARVIMEAPGGEAPTVIDLQSLEASDLNLEGRPANLSLSLSVPREDAPPAALALEATLTVDAAGEALQLDSLEATLSGATAEALTLRARGAADLGQLTADLEVETAIGPARGEGTLRYAAAESPQIDADLHFNQLNPALLLVAGPDAAASGAGDSAPEPGSAGGGGDQPLPLDALRQIDTRARLRIDSAVYQQHEVTDLNARLRAVDGVVELSTLEGQLHGGKLALNGTFNARHNTARLDTEGSLRGVDLPRLLAALEASPMLTGTASIDWQLTSRGATANALRDHLDGPIGIHTGDLVLQGLGIERLLCQAVALVNRESLSAELPENSAFEALTADIRVADGRARLEDSLAERDPACRVNERYTAIDWPLACEGNLGGEPAKWCTVDTAAIIEALGRNEVQRKVQEEAGRLFDRLRKGDKD